MGDSIETFRIKQHGNNVEMLLQQRGSKLSPLVTMRSFVGKNAEVVNQVGEAVVVEIAFRHSDTEATDVPKARRWARPRNYGTAEFVDKEDLVTTLVNPTSEIAVAQAWGLGRQQDLTLITAALGSNFIGEEGTTEVTAANDGVEVVDSAGTNKMTVDKLKTAKKHFMENEVDIDREQLFVSITAEQHDSLLKETQAINLDYTNKPVLVDGRITGFMGFNFVHTELLTTNASSKRRCFAWAKSGLVLGIWNGIEASIDRLPEKWNNIQVMAKMSIGATRTQGQKVVEIVCDE